MNSSRGLFCLIQCTTTSIHSSSACCSCHTRSPRWRCKCRARAPRAARSQHGTSTERVLPEARLRCVRVMLPRWPGPRRLPDSLLAPSCGPLVAACVGTGKIWASLHRHRNIRSTAVLAMPLVCMICPSTLPKHVLRGCGAAQAFASTTADEVHARAAAAPPAVKYTRIRC